jgi:tetratricopeptide (TPR) repeat protein
MDRCFAPAWVAFGHAFAAQDESDQAMSAYRTAARLFPGLHAPLLGSGREYLRMGNLPLAEQALRAAHRLCPGDPLTCNELGVLSVRAGRHAEAVDWLRRALALAPQSEWGARARRGRGWRLRGGTWGRFDPVSRHCKATCRELFSLSLDVGLR